MRDSPNDAPIPERFEPNTYHRDALAEAQAALTEFTFRTLREHEAFWKSDMVERHNQIAEAIEDNTTKRQRYEAMIDKVTAWQPPTPEHEEMKTFMRNQLMDSLAFDTSDDPAKYCADPNESFEDWLKAKRERLEHNVDYHRKGWADDQRRAEERTAWLQALRQSLEETAQ